MTRKFVCKTADIPQNGMMQFSAEGGLELLVANAGEEYFAVQAICPHLDVALCEGIWDGKVLTCHQHLWQWDIRTGSAMGFAEAPLEYYNVKVEGGDLFIEAPHAVKLAELFAGLSEATLNNIVAISSQETHEAGTTLYNVGDPATDIYVLESGRINFAIGRSDRQTPDGFALRKGEVFGWNALLEQYPQRIAAATCIDKASVVKINGKEMLRILGADPYVGFEVMRRLSSLINRYLSAPSAK